MIGKLSIELGGSIRHITFGQNAWYLFTKMENIPISEIGKYIADYETNPHALRDMVYCGLVAAAKVNNTTVDYNEYAVGDWLDKATPETTGKILDAFFESRGIETTKKKDEPEREELYIPS